MHRASKVLFLFQNHIRYQYHCVPWPKPGDGHPFIPPKELKKNASYSWWWNHVRSMHTYRQTDRQIDRHTYTHTHIHTHACMHAYIHMHIHMYIYICIYEDIPIECNRPIIMILSSWWDNRTPYTQYVSSDIPMMLEYFVIKHHFCQFKPACWYCCCWCSSSSCFFFKTYFLLVKTMQNPCKPM